MSSIKMPSNRRSILHSPVPRPSLVSGPAASENLNASLSENNDAAEKRERTRSRLVEIQLSASPRNSESRNSFGSIASLNAVQLAEHYTSCMKLSNENKINAKNAFQLQLIDYMAMMLKKKDSELDNFQVASCTLDASTKIYAYRVDSIHSDAIKMAGGLLRTDNSKKKGGDDVSDGEEGKENVEGQPTKKKKTSRRCATVESNLKNLNSKEVDRECRIDPFFKRMATRFDEGQSGGCHFLANLRILDDSQEIILSSDIPWWRNCQPDAEKPKEMVSIPIPNFEAIKSAEICPTFSNFTFNGWSPENDESIVCSDFAGRFGQDQVLGRDAEHAFDMNAVPEPVDGSDNEMHDVCDDMDIDNDMDENTVGTVEVMGCMNQKKGKSSWEFTDLRKVLSTDPQEYSYFQKGAMIGWAGPSHWKIRPLIRMDGQMKVPGKKKTRKVVTLGYETMTALESDFKSGDKPICLTDGTIDKWNSLKTTLPEDLHLGVSSLLRMFLKPTMAVHAKKSGAVDVDGVGQYDFDNENDKENYCTNLGNDDDDNSDDDERDVSAVFPIVDDENQDFSQAESGYDLVQAPNMVVNVYIPYAKRAKKIDMKRLQKTIYKALTDKDSKEDGAVPAQQEQTEVYLKNTYVFSEVFQHLPKKLPLKEAQNLSFPLAFVALLHIANDKTLKVEDNIDLTDLIISQDEKLC